MASSCMVCSWLDYTSSVWVIRMNKAQLNFIGLILFVIILMLAAAYDITAILVSILIGAIGFLIWTIILFYIALGDKKKNE